MDSAVKFVPEYDEMHLSGQPSDFPCLACCCFSIPILYAYLEPWRVPRVSDWRNEIEAMKSFLFWVRFELGWQMFPVPDS